MGVYALKPRFRRALRPVLAGMRRFHPNAISAFAVVCALLAGTGLYLAAQVPWVYLLVPVLLFLRIAFNALDGMVAQARSLASPRGELVNEFSDRLNDALILGGLLLGGGADARLVWGAMAITFLVTFLGTLPRGAGGARRFDGPLGKADRMLLLGLACIAAYVAQDTALVWTVALGLWIALGIVTLANRWRRAWRNLEAP